MTTFPKGSWDVHVHVFDHALFPYKPDRHYTPKPSSLESLVEASECQNFVLVQASFEAGIDGILHHLRRARELYPDRQFRGEIFWDDRAAGRDRDELHRLGVRCLRVHGEFGNNGASGDSKGWEVGVLRRLREVAAPQGWAVAAQLPLATWIDIAPSLGLGTSSPGEEGAGEPATSASAPIIAEHFGSPPPVPLSDAQMAQFEAFVDLLRRYDGFYVKLSALHRRLSPSATGLGDMGPLIATLASRAPHALLYGSDFPHVDAKAKGLEPADLLPVSHADEALVLRRGMPDHAWWEMLVGNPSKVFS